MRLGQRSSAYQRIASRQGGSLGKGGSKFQDPRAEELYNETPDEEESDQDTGGSWFGLYRNDVGAGVILEEDQQGFVDILLATDDVGELESMWEEITNSISGEGY